MGHKALGRTLTARESLARQALGLGVLVLAVGTAYAVPTASTSTPSPSACRARDSRAVSVRPSALWPIAPCADTAGTVEQPGCQARTVEPKLPGLSRLAGGAGQKSTGRWRRPGDVRADTACQPACGCHVRRRTGATGGPS